jgi:hypothetical protein
VRRLHHLIKVLPSVALLSGCGSNGGPAVVGSVEVLRGNGTTAPVVPALATEQESLSPTDPLFADSCADATGPGTYKGYTCEDSNNFIIAEDVSCQDARRKCGLNAKANPSLSFYCTWNDRVVYRKEISAGACNAEVCQSNPGTGRRVLYFCISPTELQPAIISDSITCQSALDNCKLNADVNTHRSVLCTWNDEEIFRRERVAGVCGAPSSQ